MQSHMRNVVFDIVNNWYFCKKFFNRIHVLLLLSKIYFQNTKIHDDMRNVIIIKNWKLSLKRDQRYLLKYFKNEIFFLRS